MDCIIVDNDVMLWQFLCVAGVLFFLGWTAWMDARSGRIPDKLLILGSICALGAVAFGSPAFVSGRFRILDFALPIVGALAVGGAIWALNEIWFRLRGQDALGMGDAKWSAVAALGLGATPVLWAWALAAWLGLAWLGLARIRGRKPARLHFAPFLFLALLIVKLPGWPF